MIISFASRKVRLGRDYYVEARVAGGGRYCIGSFKFRGRADDWIARHSANWTPDAAPPPSGPALDPFCLQVEE